MYRRDGVTDSKDKPMNKKQSNRHPLYPEPGAWVIDDIHGMPKLKPPRALPKEKLSAQEIRDEYVSYEGLGFCIFEYIPPEKVTDSRLRFLWARARNAMIEVVDYLEDVPEAKQKRRVIQKDDYVPIRSAAVVETLDGDDLEEI